MTSTGTAHASAANDDLQSTAAPVDQEQLPVDELAKRVLAREFRPRVGSVRRLAEAVLARKETAQPDKPKKKKKAASDKAGKRAGGKKRKLAKIPGQKGKKKV